MSDNCEKSGKIRDANDSDHLVPEAYMLYCPKCGEKWASKKEEEQPCPDCGKFGRVTQQLYPGIHVTPKRFVHKQLDKIEEGQRKLREAMNSLLEEFTQHSEGESAEKQP